MKTKTIEVFSFAELSDEAKEKARAWYREGALDYDWWGSVYDDAKTIGDLMGIEIDDIFFSGFASQGDGACFTGRYRYAPNALAAVKNYAPQATDLHDLAQSLETAQILAALQGLRLAATIVLGRGSNYYSHSGTMDVTVYDTNDETRDIGNLEENIQEAMRNFADWIYGRLEDEHDWLTSDEAVDDSLMTNEYEFDVDGNVI